MRSAILLSVLSLATAGGSLYAQARYDNRPQQGYPQQQYGYQQPQDQYSPQQQYEYGPEQQNSYGPGPDAYQQQQPAYGYQAYGAPPAYDYQPPCPGPGYSWTAGYWYPSGRRRIWRAGFWAPPVFRGGYSTGFRYSSPSYSRGYYQPRGGYQGGYRNNFRGNSRDARRGSRESFRGDHRR